MNVRENDRVQAVGGIHDGKVGTVKSVYDLIDMAIVDFDNDTVAKVPLSYLVKIKSQENQGDNSEIPEGAKYITKTEFMEAISEVTKPDKLVETAGADKATIVGLGVLMSGIKLTEKLFKDADIILITKNQLDHEIAASAMDEDPKFMVVALVNSIILRGIVNILFSGDSDND